MFYWLFILTFVPAIISWKEIDILILPPASFFAAIFSPLSGKSFISVVFPTFRGSHSGVKRLFVMKNGHLRAHGGCTPVCSVRMCALSLHRRPLTSRRRPGGPSGRKVTVICPFPPGATGRRSKSAFRHPQEVLTSVGATAFFPRLMNVNVCRGNRTVSSAKVPRLHDVSANSTCACRVAQQNRARVRMVFRIIMGRRVEAFALTNVRTKLRIAGRITIFAP